LSVPISQLVSDLVSQGKWDEAYAGLFRFAQQNPAGVNDPALQYQLGVLAFNSGKLAEAERHLKTSLSINAVSPEAHYQLGLVLLKDNRANEAMPEFREACERREVYAVGHLHWGMALMAMGSFRGAIGQFNQAIKIDTKLTAAYVQGGMASFRMGQFMEAAQYFQAAVNNDPDIPEPLVCLGLALAALGNEGDAGKCYMRAWQLDGKDVTTLRYAASAMAASGMIDDAVRLFQESVSMGHRVLSARERALVYNDWGVSLFKVGRAEEAADKLMEASDMDSTCLEPAMNLGLVCIFLTEYERAVEAFERALAINPGSTEVRVYLAVTLLLVNQCKQAIARLQEKEQDGRFDFWLGHGYLGVGNYEKASFYFDRVLRESPTNYQAIDGLGCAFMLAGNYPEAVEKFMQAIKLREDYALGHLHLSRAFDQMGDPALAAQHLRTAVQCDPECLNPQKEALDRLLEAAKYELVEAQSQKILAVAPHDLDVRVFLARALKEQNKLDEALELIASVITQDPKNPGARIVAGQIFMSQGRFVEADQMFREADEHCDGEPVLFYCWGRTLSLLGLHELALEKYEKASELDPYDADVYDAWGATLKTLGRFSDAADVYRRAAEYI
jgi:tetratricopeptide (TPR) repeat protein